MICNDIPRHVSSCAALLLVSFGSHYRLTQLTSITVVGQAGDVLSRDSEAASAPRKCSWLQRQEGKVEVTSQTFYLPAWPSTKMETCHSNARRIISAGRGTLRQDSTGYPKFFLCHSGPLSFPYHSTASTASRPCVCRASPALATQPQSCPRSTEFLFLRTWPSGNKGRQPYHELSQV